MARQSYGRKTRQAFYKRPIFQIYKAYLLAVVASILYGVGDIVVKSVHYMSVSQLAFVRSAGLFTLNLPLLHYKRQVIYNKASFPFLFARGLFGCVALYMGYIGIKLMPIAETTIIVSTTPVWVALIARIFLKESLDKWNCASIVACMIGLFFMSRVFTITAGYSGKYSDPNYWYGCLASILCAIILAHIYIFLRRLKGVHPTVTIIYQSVIGIFVMAGVELILWKLTLPQCGKDGVKLVALAVLSFVGQFALTAAFRHDKAGPVALAHEASYVAVSFFVQILYFNEIPDVYSIIAAIFVILSLVLSAMGKIVQKKKEHCDEDVNAETEI